MMVVAVFDLTWMAPMHSHCSLASPQALGANENLDASVDAALEHSLGATQALVHHSLLALARRGTVCSAALSTHAVNCAAQTFDNAHQACTTHAGTVVVDLIGASEPYVSGPVKGKNEEDSEDSDDEEGETEKTLDNANTDDSMPMIVVSSALATLLGVEHGDALTVTFPSADGESITWLHPNEVDVVIVRAPRVVAHMLESSIVPVPTGVAVVARAQFSRALASVRALDIECIVFNRLFHTCVTCNYVVSEYVFHNYHYVGTFCCMREPVSVQHTAACG